jgi:hypothetical protein
MFHSAKSLRQALWRKGHVMHVLHERPLSARPMHNNRVNSGLAQTTAPAGYAGFEGYVTNQSYGAIS